MKIDPITMQPEFDSTSTAEPSVRLYIEGDVMYRDTPVNKDIVRREVIMTREVFELAYRTWISKPDDLK